MTKRMNFSSRTAMIDAFLLIAVGFVALFVVAFLLIKPVVPQTKDVDAEEDLIVTLRWDDTHDTDLDLWMKGPEDTIVSFKRLNSNGATLERDDRGFMNEVLYVNGEMVIANTNIEVLRIKKLLDGEYYFSVQFYSNKSGSSRKGAGIISEDFQLDIYDNKKHKYVSFSNDTVSVFGEKGIIKITVENGIIMNIEKSKEIIALPFRDGQSSNGGYYNGTPGYNYGTPNQESPAP